MKNTCTLIFLIAFCYCQSTAVAAADFVNFNQMEFVSIPTGSSWMGSCNSLISTGGGEGCDSTSLNDTYAFADETPRHRVEITRSLQVATHSVSVREFLKYITDTSSLQFFDNIDFLLFNENKDDSVRYISWQETQGFLSWLNQRKPSEDKSIYRLPTEAEWEYIARSGKEHIYFFGNSHENLRKYAHFADNDQENESLGSLDTKLANPWGVYNIYGNVWEWVSDWYDPNYYNESVVENPTGPESGRMRVIRGGAFNFDSSYCRSAARESYPPNKRSRSIGFRVVREMLEK